MPDIVLVADRGVVARRVVRTLQRLGVKAVTVHASDDRLAEHVLAADDSVLLGGGAESYGDGVKLVEAARQAGAAAVHPGSGSLAADPAFARRVRDAGLVWVGPDLDDVRELGLADLGGVTGPAGDRLEVQLLLGAAAVVLGGRRVTGTGAAAVAVSCAVDDASARVALAAASGLHGLVTVVLAAGRASVVPHLTAAHVVTELVTGLDLVEQQLRLADDPAAALDPPTTSGVAVMVPLLAAAPGEVTGWDLPPGTDELRLDVACAVGDVLLAGDDPLLAIVAAHGPDQDAALARLQAALSEVAVEGLPLDATGLDLLDSLRRTA